MELTYVHHHLIVAEPGLVNVLSKTILLVLIAYNEVRGESFLKVVQWYVWTTGTYTEPMECYCSEVQFIVIATLLRSYLPEEMHVYGLEG